jgi:quinolinate synthase
MLRHVQNSQCNEFIIGTECGIVHRLQKENPQKKFHLLCPEPVCADMKKITLESIRDALLHQSGEVILDEETMRLARRPIEKMLEIS